MPLGWSSVPQTLLRSLFFRWLPQWSQDNRHKSAQFRQTTVNDHLTQALRTQHTTQKQTSQLCFKPCLPPVFSTLFITAASIYFIQARNLKVNTDSSFWHPHIFNVFLCFASWILLECICLLHMYIKSYVFIINQYGLQNIEKQKFTLMQASVFLNLAVFEVCIFSCIIDSWYSEEPHPLWGTLVP